MTPTSQVLALHAPLVAPLDSARIEVMDALVETTRREAQKVIHHREARETGLDPVNP